MGLTLRRTPSLYAVADSDTAVTLYWSAVPDATGYRIYRDGSLAHSAGAGTYPQQQSWQDTGRTAETAYSYRVAALFGTREGTKSKPRSVTTLETPPATLAWNIPDSPYSVPGTWYSQTADQTYDVSQHATDTNDVGVYSITSQSKNDVVDDYGFTIDADTGVISLPSDLADPVSASDSYDVAIRLAAAVSAAEADWQRRLSASNVNGSLQWYHRYETEAEVTNFTPTTERARVLWSSNGGPQGQGCVRCIVPAGAQAGGNTLQRVFAPQPGDPAYAGGPVFNPNSATSYFHGYYGHPDYHDSSAWLGHEFWLSMKMRFTPSRFSGAWKVNVNSAWVEPNPAHALVYPFVTAPAGGGKGPCWLIARQTNAQEIVLGPSDNTLVLQGVINYSVGLTVFRTVDGVNYGYQQPNGHFDPSCDYRVNSSYAENNGNMRAYDCYRYPGFYNWYLGTSHSEWHTYMVRMKMGHRSTADTLYEVYVCEDDGMWKRLFRRDDIRMYEVGAPFPFMHDRTYISGYHNNYWFREGHEQQYTDVIFKKAHPDTPSEADPEVWGIPAPAAGL